MMIFVSHRVASCFTQSVRRGVVFLGSLEVEELNNVAVLTAYILTLHPVLKGLVLSELLRCLCVRDPFSLPTTPEGNHQVISLSLMCQCLRYLCYVRVGPVSSGWYLIFLLRTPSFLNLCHGLAFDLYLWSTQLMSHTLPPRAWGKVLLILASCRSAGSHQSQLKKKKISTCTVQQCFPDRPV